MLHLSAAVVNSFHVMTGGTPAKQTKSDKQELLRGECQRELRTALSFIVDCFLKLVERCRYIITNEVEIRHNAIQRLF